MGLVTNALEGGRGGGVAEERPEGEFDFDFATQDGFGVGGEGGTSVGFFADGDDPAFVEVVGEGVPVGWFLVSAQAVDGEFVMSAGGDFFFF